VKVTPDACHVNYVHCERCQDRWAAIGGRNITRTSLLSTETTEPDLAARGVRYSLFEIVKLARERQALSTLPESPTAAPSHTESTVPNTHTITRYFCFYLYLGHTSWSTCPSRPPALRY
jgi:hypothetical protein